MYYTIPSCRSSVWKTQYTSTASIGITRLLMITRTSLTVKCARQKFWQFAGLARSGVCKHNAIKSKRSAMRERGVVGAQQSGEGYKAPANNLKSIILQWGWRGNIQDSCQSMKEGTSQQIHPQVTLCDAQNTKNKQKSYFSDSTGLSYHGEC